MKNKTIRITALGLAFALPLVASANGRISGVTVKKVGPNIQVSIQGSELQVPTVRTTEGGTSCYFDLDASLANGPEKSNVGIGNVIGVQTLVVTKKPAKSRVRIQFLTPQVTRIEPTSTGLALWLIDGPVAKKASQKPDFILGAEPLITANPPRDLYAAYRGSMSMGAELGILSVQTQTSANSFAGTRRAEDRQNPRVSLDFVNTDVVQIIKALALQTKTNIVTSPDVKGKLSVTLENVTTREALSLITSLSGLRFSQVGKTYIVTTNEKYLQTLRAVGGNEDEPAQTRVVPIFCGEGNQIKAAVLKSISTENQQGKFEIVLPSERVNVLQKQDVSPKSGEAEKDDKQGTQLEVRSAETAKDAYIVLIGSPSRLGEVETMVKMLDRQICQALGIRIPTSNSPVSKTYLVKGGRAQDLVHALAGQGKSSVGTVELFATPSTSISRQTIVLKGREDEVAQVMMNLEQLDSSEHADLTEFTAVDLEFVDPRSARELLISNIPGLSVTIPPASVGNPKLYMPNQIRTMSEERGTDAPAPQGPGSPLAQGNQNGANMAMQGGQQGMGGQVGQQANVGNDKGELEGLALPFQAFEQFAVPMKLVLRGSKDQVERAMAYIKVIDTAPKQVALELRVMELSKDDLNQIGLDWNLLSGGAIKTIKVGQGVSNAPTTIGGSINGNDVTGSITATLDAVANKSNLIARPNLLALDGRETEIFIGDAIRYVESILSSQNGPSVTTGTVRVGVRLAVLPRVGGNGSLTLDLRPVVSFLRGFEAIPQIGGKLPQTSERIAQATLNIKSGETIAIGGLIQDQDRLAVSGLPFLKDLPILGPLFSRTTIQKVKTDLVIFLTARALEGPASGGNTKLPIESTTTRKPGGNR